MNLHLLHLVGIGERERTAEVGKLAWGVEVPLGYGAVADDVDVDICHREDTIRGLVHMGRNVAYGQLAAQPATHDGRTRLGDVDGECGFGSYGTDLGHVHHVAYIQRLRTGTA